MILTSSISQIMLIVPATRKYHYLGIDEMFPIV